VSVEEIAEPLDEHVGELGVAIAPGSGQRGLQLVLAGGRRTRGRLQAHQLDALGHVDGVDGGQAVDEGDGLLLQTGHEPGLRAGALVVDPQEGPCPGVLRRTGTGRTAQLLGGRPTTAGEEQHGQQANEGLPGPLLECHSRALFTLFTTTLAAHRATGATQVEVVSPLAKKTQSSHWEQLLHWLLA